MARTRRRGTLVDYLVAAIEPALIITMVGSLMFFLLDMWYDGPVIDRLRWILFWFVLGIVLITRVSMQIGTNLAGSAAVANRFDGVDVYNTGATVGGTSAGASNLISGNANDGVVIGAPSCLVEGNQIGTNIKGAAAFAVRSLPTTRALVRAIRR